MEALAEPPLVSMSRVPPAGLGSQVSGQRAGSRFASGGPSARRGNGVAQGSRPGGWAMNETILTLAVGNRFGQLATGWQVAGDGHAEC